MRIADALAAARAQGVDRLDAQLLLAHHLGRPRAWLLAHDTDELPPDTAAAWQHAAGVRAAGMPLAYLLGEREFRGLALEVTPAVLVPRPETEHLVDWALERLASVTMPRVADLGTGSGAIAVAVGRARPDALVDAVDVSAAALAVARRNAARHRAVMRLSQGHWWSGLRGRRFELVLSNPPYVAQDDPHLDALRHEPRGALAAGPDGLADLRQIIRQAPDHLADDGWLLVEHGHDQGPPVRDLMAAAGLLDISTRRDLAGLERCSGARRPPRINTPAAGTAFAV